MLLRQNWFDVEKTITTDMTFSRQRRTNTVTQFVCAQRKTNNREERERNRKGGREREKEFLVRVFVRVSCIVIV